jgi:pimeloyl-ACP methyl ester carboxylesterase
MKPHSRSEPARATTNGSASPSPSWLHQAAFRLDRWGDRARTRHARSAAQRPGYAVLETRDGSVRVRVHGSGPALVFMTDPPLPLEQYDELVACLAADYTVIVLEPLGFGFSTFAPRVWSFPFERSLANIQEALVQLNRGPYVLAFPCVSAYSALALAERAPELVSALVLAQAPAWREMLLWKAARDPLGVLSRPLLGQLALRAFKQKRSHEWLALASGSRERRREFIAGVDAAFVAGAAFPLASAFQALPDERLVLPAVATPTLFLWGLRDRSHRSTDRQSSLEHAPGGCLVEAQHLGHFPELEDPRWFAATLRSFLRDVLPSAGHGHEADRKGAPQAAK